MKQKLQAALIQQAMLRWENAVLIALAILLTAFVPQPFDFWPAWGWGVLALIGVIAITLSGLGESQVREAAIDDMLYADYNPLTIQTPALRGAFLQSLKYRRNIEAMTAATPPDGIIRSRLNDLTDKVKQWTGYIYQLARMLDDYQRDPMLQRDPAVIRAEVARLQAQAQNETNPVLTREARLSVESKQKFLQTSEALKDKMRAAAMQLEQSQDAMATIYTQIKLLETRDMDGVNTQAIDHDIDEQVARMSDLLEGLQKAYQEGKA
jgi:hypothetical protein